MLLHPQIDPVALQLGPLAIHWYGLTYLAAFGLFMFLGFQRLAHEPYASIKGAGAWTRKDVEDILFLGVMGVVLGGRIGYCLFYKPAYYASHPLEILWHLACRQAWRVGGWATSSMVSCGAAFVTQTCPGAWFFAGQETCHGTRHRFTSS